MQQIWTVIQHEALITSGGRSWGGHPDRGRAAVLHQQRPGGRRRASDRPAVQRWRGWPSAKLPFCCTPLSLYQVLQYGWRGDTSRMAVSPTARRGRLHDHHLLELLPVVLRARADAGRPGEAARNGRLPFVARKQIRSGTSPENAVVRETIMDRQVHFQSSD